MRALLRRIQRQQFQQALDPFVNLLVLFLCLQLSLSRYGVWVEDVLVVPFEPRVVLSQRSHRTHARLVHLLEVVSRRIRRREEQRSPTDEHGLGTQMRLVQGLYLSCEFTHLESMVDQLPLSMSPEILLHYGPTKYL